MNINDLLKKSEFNSLDKFLTDEMYGFDKDLIKRLNQIFGDEQVSRDWFYSNNSSFDNKRPYDLCKNGEVDKVYNCLGRIEPGIYN